MIWWFVIIFVCYFVLIFSFVIGFRKVPNFVSEKQAPIISFSIVIPFRNEIDALPLLLTSISKLEYPSHLFEILFIDDASSDASVNLIKESCTALRNGKIKFSILQNCRMSNSPKKDAILTAIKQAKNNWIVTTDADCVLPKNWLQVFNDYIHLKQPKMMVAPVTYSIKNTFFEQFQHLDFLSLQGATIGGFGIGKPFLCNGANLAYKKECFKEVNGFEGNTNIASGDDIFLFEKFVKAYPKKVQFIKSNQVIVQTFPVKTIKDLINQRVRWASKTANYQLGFAKLVGIIVFFANFSLLILFFLAFFKQVSYQQLVLFFSVKLVVDFFLFLKIAQFFEQKKALYQSYLISSLLYPFFNVFVVFMAIFSSYEWKGRSFKE